MHLYTSIHIWQILVYDKNVSRIHTEPAFKVFYNLEQVLTFIK